MEPDNKEEKKLEERVTIWIGSNNHIGLILPESSGKDVDAEWDELHNEVAKIMAKEARKMK